MDWSGFKRIRLGQCGLRGVQLLQREARLTELDEKRGVIAVECQAFLQRGGRGGEVAAARRQVGQLRHGSARVELAHPLSKPARASSSFPELRYASATSISRRGSISPAPACMCCIASPCRPALQAVHVIAWFSISLRRRPRAARRTFLAIPSSSRPSTVSLSSRSEEADLVLRRPGPSGDRRRHVAERRSRSSASGSIVRGFCGVADAAVRAAMSGSACSSASAMRGFDPQVLRFTGIGLRIVELAPR